MAAERDCGSAAGIGNQPRVGRRLRKGIVEVQQVPGNLKEVGPKPLIMGQNKEKNGTDATVNVT